VGRRHVRGAIRAGLSACFVFLVAAAPGLSAQTLTLKEEPPASSFLCDPAVDAPSCRAADPAEVNRLISEATQALILGDLDAADQLLTRALDLDPCAVEATYTRGRIVAQTQGVEAASEWFCRYLALAPLGASAPEARRRLDQAIEAGAAEDLRTEFQAGVEHYQLGEMQQAEAAFTAVLDLHPVPEALFDRALTRLALDRPVEARRDLAQYVERRPESDEAEVIAGALARPAADWTRRSPATAFLLGALLPGAGQYYTGRTVWGLAVTTLAGGAVAAGYSYKETTIQCRAPDSSGQCPPDAIAGRETARPFLLPAIGVGAGVMLLSAIEAAFHARGNKPPLTIAAAGGAVRVGITPRASLRGRSLDIAFLQLRH
jgi:tetratricopeptide (TPR) repeat protein